MLTRGLSESFTALYGRLGMQLRHSWLFLVPVALAAGTLVSITGAQPGARSEAMRAGGVLRVNVSETDIPSLDPALNYDVVGWQVQAATCVNLLNYPDREGSAGARLAPEVAVAMPRVSPDGRSYTFTIRSGYRFNTGAPVTAGSFARAIERALSPKLRSPGSTFVRDIVGAAAFAAGKAKRISGVRASGNRLSIRLAAPAPDFLARIAMPFFCAVPRDFPIVPPGGTTPPSAGPF